MMLKLGIDKTIQMGNRGSNTNFDPDMEMGYKWVIHFIRFILYTWMIEIYEMIHKISNQAQYPQPDISLPYTSG